MSGHGRMAALVLAVLPLCLPAATPPVAFAQAQGQAGLPGIEYGEPPSWQRAAVVALSRQLPADSGYWALGPIDPAVERQDSLRLVRTTLRILVPGPRESRTVTRRLWVPTGGVALQEMQPADSLPHEPPPGYPGRFLRGTVAGQSVYVQVLTVRQHRWLVWADRVLFTEVEDAVRGPLVQYSEAIARHLEGEGGGAPRASDYRLDRAFDLFGELEDPVIRDRAGYLRLLDENRTFSLGDAVHDAYGVVPAPRLADWLADRAEPHLLVNRGGDAAFQRAWRDYVEAGGAWTGLPLLNVGSTAGLEPGRYAYAVDRYGLIRVGRLPDADADAAAGITPALLVHNDPVRAAGVLRIEADPDGGPRVASFDIRSEEYLFSNLSLSIYEDIESRSDAFLLGTVGHVLRALADADIPYDETLIRKF